MPQVGFDLSGDGRRTVLSLVSTDRPGLLADVTAVLKDGQRVHVFVEHAIGSLANPMSDAQLEAKFRGMADAVLGKGGCLIETSFGTVEAGIDTQLESIRRVLQGMLP